jgi:hypothetical protein
MPSWRAINNAFADGYTEVRTLYDAGKLPECIEEAHKLIANPAIPRYYQMLALIMLHSFDFRGLERS